MAKKMKTGVKHHFKLHRPGVKSVRLSGTFNKWDISGVECRQKNGVWLAEVELKSGKYEYKFLVDGIWETDPEAEKVGNIYGTENSVLVIS